MKDNCFDFLRYLFAISLVLAHFCTQVGIEQFWFITGAMRVRAFFVITGFLVTYSLTKSPDLGLYFTKRLARIVPAYLVAVLLCFVLGMCVTELPLSEFLSSWPTWRYLGANLLMLNWMEPELPCTFQHLSEPQMNGSLWSMKFEVLFYLMLPLLLWICRQMGKRWFVASVALLCLPIYWFLPVQLQYFVFFFSGMAVFLFFDEIARYWRYIIPVALASQLVVWTTEGTWLFSFCFIIEPITFALLLVGIAYSCRWLNFVRRYDNITYGIYLYHFPVIQLLIWSGLAGYSLPLCFGVALLLSCVLGYLSWHFVEQPLMAYNKMRARALK